MIRKLLAVSTGLVLAAMLPSCSGSSSSTVSTTPPTTTPPCTQTTLAQESAPVEALTVVGGTLTTTTTGRLDVTVDWTFPSSDIGVYLTRQDSCDEAQFNAGTCAFIIRSEGGAKPRKVSAPNLAPGAYDLFVANFSEHDESVSALVVLSSSTCPALTSVGRSTGYSRSRTVDSPHLSFERRTWK
jgi:hypothetical protein